MCRILIYWYLIAVGKEAAFDYISVTPPYMLVDYAVLMDQIANSSVVGENTFMVSHTRIFCWFRSSILNHNLFVLFLQVVEYPLRTDMLDSCSCLVKVT